MKSILDISIYNNYLCSKESNGEIMYIANFIPTVQKIEIEDDMRGGEQKFLILSIDVEGNVLANNFKFPLEQVNQIDYKVNVSHKCIIYPGRDKRKLLNFYIEAQMAKINAQITHITDTVGWHCFKGVHFYATSTQFIGAKAIQQNNVMHISKKIKNLHIDVDANASEEYAAEHMLHVAHIDSITLMLISNFIIGLTRSIFVESGATPEFVVYLSGHQGSLKTTLACFTSSLYQRFKDTEFSKIALTSTESGLEKATAQFRDCTVIIDDLVQSASSSIIRKQEARIETLIRAIANKQGRQKSNGNSISMFAPEFTAVFTAEYKLQTPSIITRCIMLDIEHSINKDALTKCQNSPLLISTFAVYFLQWVSKNYEKILLQISTEAKTLREHTAGNQNERMNQNYGILQIGYILLLDYCESIGVITQEEKHDIFTDYKKALSQFYTKQFEYLKKMETASQPVDIPMMVFKLFDNKKFYLDKNNNAADGYLKNECLYISITAIQRNVLGIYNISLTEKQISSVLKMYNLLILDSTGKSTKKVLKGNKRQRMLQISLYALKEYVSTRR